ncbi:MAG: hypothetical protein ACK40G_01365 [Cytophagaceae bacterium]
MKNFIITFLIASIVTFMMSCQSERYRKGTAFKMDKEASRASNYLSNQAEEITKENIKDKDKRARRNRKQQLKEQERLNELNASSSKVKKDKNKKHHGKYSLY